MNDDISILCKHKFLEELKDKLPSEQKRCLELIAYGQDILYVWNDVDACVHSINVKLLLRDIEAQSHLILQPLQSVLFSPDRIFLNVSSSLLALASSSDEGSGIAVIEIPERWTAEKEKVRVPCKNIGERLFLGEQLTLRQAKWHPASPSDSHLLVLTSDECLRLFNASTGEIMWKCYLSKSMNRMSHNALPTKFLIGDSPVDFDIGPPTYDQNPAYMKWPVFLLWGNGDIYCLESEIEDCRDKIPIVGPLRMFPSSDDNYGSDACSILVMQTVPPIVVFATSVGTIYNSILLSNEEQQTGYEKSLYVVECIELELGITIGEEEDILSCPTRLLRNPIEKSMYFAIHKAGIHSVMLPLVSKLQEFLESSESILPPYNYKSVVEYLVCTGLNRSCSLDALPLLGCSFIEISSSLLVLLNNSDLVSIRVTPHVLHSVQNLDVVVNHSQYDDGFFLYIQSILKEHAPGPLIRLPEAEPLEIFNIIYKMKQTYKKTMDAHEIVAKKLKGKSEMLLAVFGEQEEKTKVIAEEQEELYQQALKIAERYSQLNQKQLDLMNRIENILRNVCSDSKLSERERSAVDYLENVEKKMEIFQKEMKRMEAANRHQGNMVGERNDKMARRGIDLGDTRGRTMRKQLHNLTLEIGQVMRRIKKMEETVPDLMFRPHHPSPSYN